MQYERLCKSTLMAANPRAMHQGESAAQAAQVIAALSLPARRNNIDL